MEPWVWIVIGVVALLLIIAVIAMMSRNSASAKRKEADELREKAREQELQVREREAAAAKTAADADAARAEADQQAAAANQQAAAAKQREIDAERLTDKARERDGSLREARSEHDDLLRRADEVDPDVDRGRDGSRGVADGQRARGDRDGDGKYEMNERVRDGLDDRRGGHPQDQAQRQYADGQHADGRQVRGDRDGDGKYEMNERVRDGIDDRRDGRDPRAQDPRMQDPRAQDPRAQDPRMQEGRQVRGDRDGDGKYEMGERARDAADRVRGRDDDIDGRRR